MDLDQVRGFELKYAGIPFPLEIVKADVAGDVAQVTRSCALGPLHASGTDERWIKDTSGAWRLSETIERFGY